MRAYVCIIVSAASNYVLWISEGVEIRLVDGLVLCRTLTAENLICVTITIVYCQNRIAVTFLLSFFLASFALIIP